VAQSLPAMADRDVVGYRRGEHHAGHFFSIFMEAPRRFNAVPEMGGR
jgi:hypothetical protein